MTVSDAGDERTEVAEHHTGEQVEPGVRAHQGGAPDVLDRTATTLEHHDDHVLVTLDDDTRVRAGAVLITSGIGKFSPRPLPAGDGWVATAVDNMGQARACGDYVCGEDGPLVPAGTGEAG